MDSRFKQKGGAFLELGSERKQHLIRFAKHNGQDMIVVVRRAIDDYTNYEDSDK